MCNKAILENDGTLQSVPNQYKTREMCDKAINNNAHALRFVPPPHKTQEMWIKAVDNYPSKIQFVPGYYKPHEMCNKVVNTCFFFFFNLILFPVNIKLKKRCDKAVDDCLEALKFIPGFLQVKCLKSLMII